MNLKLPIKLKKRPFTIDEANKSGINQYQLNLMLSDGSIEKLGRGIYRARSGDISAEDMFIMGTIWLGYPSAVCLISALSYFNLTDEIPNKIWMMVEHNKISHRKELRLVRLRHPHWEVGIKKTKHYWITGVARTIVDIFRHPQIVSTAIATQSLKQAIKERQTTVRDIYDISLVFGINQHLLPYLEMV
jgi:predicted transcriptional regulator of viral defense system